MSNCIGNNLTTDPKFVNVTYAAPDVHLQADSPDRGAGIDFSSYFTLDKDKNVRTNWDLGAYENSSNKLVLVLKS